MKANCTKCGKWFPISRNMQNLIEEGIIHPSELTTCPDCGEREEEEAEYKSEYEYQEI